MKWFGWFRRRRLPEPPIEPSPASRLRLAQATRGHAQVTRRLASVALDEVDRSASERGAAADCSNECLGKAVTEITRRYQATHGKAMADPLAEMVDFMSKGHR